MAILKDIAEKTGFSLSVVSRALNPNPDQRVALETKRKIEAAMRELNYRRNHAASQLARGRSSAVGIFLPDYGYSLIADLMIGISEAAAANDFVCNFYFGLNARDYLRFINSVKTVGSSGILSYMPGEEFADRQLNRAIAEYRRNGGNVLLLNSAGLPEIGIESVNIDGYTGGKIAAEHLHAARCEQYYCILTPNSWQSEQRYAGFCDFLKQRGIGIERHYVRTNGFHQYRDLDFERLIPAFGDRRTGIFTLSDYLGMELIRTLSRAGFGKRIGNDIRIIGYDNIPGSQYTYPALTTISQPFRELGRCGMEKLLNMVTGGSGKIIPIPYPQLIKRESA